MLNIKQLLQSKSILFPYENNRDVKNHHLKLERQKPSETLNPLTVCQLLHGDAALIIF